MKKILIIGLIIFCNFYSIAQYKDPKQKNLPDYEYKILHFGFSIGANIMDFGIIKAEDFFSTANFDKVYSVENDQVAGFNLGPIMSFRVGKYLDFRTLIILSFGQRNLQYRTIVDNNTSGVLKLHTMKISSTYLECPLLLKYKSKRMNNFQPYIIAGVNPKYDLAAQKKIKESERPKIRLNNFDVAGELGAGLDFYLPYFKFSIELKYSMGTKNMIIYDNTQYTKSIDRMTSNVWMLSFHFEGGDLRNIF